MSDKLTPHLMNRSWLEDPALKALLSALNADGEETRIIGGAVRNALLGEELSDIDCATTATPEKIIALTEAAGFKAVPTGIGHGTVTVVVEGQSFEVTSLREDVKTDGRHAVVSFGRDWEKDALRRDFTMNALSIDIEGHVHDPIEGYEDLVHHVVRFIGDPQKRIEEDYLRLLRFFRFFAWYGKGRPDRDALKAVVRTKSGLASLSAERIWEELKKLLCAPEAERAILWMRTTEVIDAILPENWGLDQFHWMLAAERDRGWTPDPILRLQAMLRPSDDVIKELSERLKLSKNEERRLLDWTAESHAAASYVSLSLIEFAKILYRGQREAILDALAHEFAKRLAKEEEGADRIPALIDFAETWVRPEFPVSGNDLMQKKNLKAGAELGVRLKQLEEQWIESDFTLSRDELLDLA